MDVPTMEQHDVWTYNDSPEWVSRNFVPDVRIVYGVNKHRAQVTAERLGELYPADTFEVRDVRGTVVDTYGAARGEVARPVPASHRGRRMLGERGRD